MDAAPGVGVNPPMRPFALSQVTDLVRRGDDEDRSGTTPRSFR